MGLRELCLLVWLQGAGPGGVAGAPPDGPSKLAQDFRLTGQLCDALEVDACIKQATALRDAADLGPEQRWRVIHWLAAANALLGDIPESERYFRLLLRLQPGFALPASTSPKILSVFRAVQADEERLRRELAAEERRQVVASIQLGVQAPPHHAGGTPLRVRAHVEDPHHAVQSLTLHYRADPAGPYATVPFRDTLAGAVAEVPAAQTASPRPYQLALFVTAQDTEGQLLSSWSTPALPASVSVAAGSIPGPPVWKQRWFWLVTGGTAAGGGAAALVATVLLAGCASAAAALAFLAQRGDGTGEHNAGSHDL